MAVGRKLQVLDGCWQVSVFYYVDLAVGHLECLHEMAAGFARHALSESKEEATKPFMM